MQYIVMLMLLHEYDSKGKVRKQKNDILVLHDV